VPRVGQFIRVLKRKSLHQCPHSKWRNSGAVTPRPYQSSEVVTQTNDKYGVNKSLGKVGGVITDVTVLTLSIGVHIIEIVNLLSRMGLRTTPLPNQLGERHPKKAQK